MEARQALLAVAMLIVGAAASLVLAAVTFFVETTVPINKSQTFAGFVYAQAPLALTLLLSVGAVLLVESFFTRTPHKLLDGLLKSAVLLMLFAAGMYYVTHVTTTTFLLYSALGVAANMNPQAVSGTPEFIQAARTASASTSTWWYMALSMFALLCAFRAMLTLHSTKNLLIPNPKDSIQAQAVSPAPSISHPSSGTRP